MRGEKRKRPLIVRLFRLVLTLAVIWVIFRLVTGWVPLMFVDGDPEGLSVNEELDDEGYNILLLGEDDADGAAYGRTDTMIVASIHRQTGELKLTSIMRDTLVSIPGHGKNKINTAYRFGGPELAMQTVNQAFGLNITKYVVVQFESFPYLVEAVGGVRMDISEEELQPLNRLVLSMRHRFKDSGMDVSELASAGENVKLTGLQAMAYSRIRGIDSDFVRTSRQRRVINAILGKVRGSFNPVRLIRCGMVALEYVETNLNLYQIGALGLKVLGGGGEIRQIRLPADGTYDAGTQDGQWSIRPNLEKNRALLYEFIYE